MSYKIFQNKNIKNVLLFTFCFLILTAQSVFAQNMVLKTGVSIDKIPSGFYGTWRVTSKLCSTNRDGLFKKSGVDLWNLSRSGNVITLDNPTSGAHASITIDQIDGSFIKFKKVGDYDGKKLTDTVKMQLKKDTFVGVNNLKLETIDQIDGHVMVTEWALYQLFGEKISGDSIK